MDSPIPSPASQPAQPEPSLFKVALRAVCNDLGVSVDSQVLAALGDVAARTVSEKRCDGVAGCRWIVEETTPAGHTNCEGRDSLAEALVYLIGALQSPCPGTTVSVRARTS